jgi:hypothetical protein
MDSKFINQIYRKDEKGTYIVEIALDNYTDLFNEWDPAPFRKRDIDQELKIYLEECSEDIPPKMPIKLEIRLPRNISDKKSEQSAITGLKNYFKLMKITAHREVGRFNKNAFWFISAAILFWIVVIPIENLDTDLTFIRILKEGLYLGGWVMGWEFFSIIMFKARHEKNRQKQYARLENAEMEFVYDLEEI